MLQSNSPPINCHPYIAIFIGLSSFVAESISGHFADDTYVLYGSKKLKTMEIVVNTELRLMCNWLRLKLSLNAKKTKLIIFHTQRRTIIQFFQIKLNGKKLSPVSDVISNI